MVFSTALMRWIRFFQCLAWLAPSLAVLNISKDWNKITTVYVKKACSRTNRHDNSETQTIQTNAAQLNALNVKTCIFLSSM